MAIRLILLSAFLTPIGNLPAGDLPPAAPHAPAGPDPWIKPTVNLRARFESARQEGSDHSHAETLRARLGLRTRSLAGTQLFAEYEGTLAADRGSYRAASVSAPPQKAFAYLLDLSNDAGSAASNHSFGCPKTTPTAIPTASRPN